MSKEYDPNYQSKLQPWLLGVKAILTLDEQILLLRRSLKSGGGGWSLPGGALDTVESPSNGMLREIEEETGLSEISNLSPFFHLVENQGEYGVLIFGFTGQIKSADVQLNWEHDEFRLLGLEEALNFELTPHAKTLISAYASSLRE